MEKKESAFRDSCLPALSYRSRWPVVWAAARGGAQWPEGADAWAFGGKGFLRGMSIFMVRLGLLGEQRGLPSLLQFWPHSPFSKPPSPEAPPPPTRQAAELPRLPLQRPPHIGQATHMKQEGDDAGEPVSSVGTPPSLGKGACHPQFVAQNTHRRRVFGPPQPGGRALPPVTSSSLPGTLLHVIILAS